MAEMILDQTIHRPKGGVRISYELTLVGEQLSVSQVGTDAIGYSHIKPFTLCRQQVSQARLCPRLLLNRNSIFYIAITAALPFLTAAMQLFYSDPNMKYLIQNVVPGIACISLLLMGLLILCNIGWCLKFTCRDGKVYLLPLVGYLIFPLHRYQRELILKLIREVKTWGNQ